MKEWEDVKQIYDNIEIPAELDDVVQKAVSQTVKGKKGHSKMKNSWLKKSLGVVAAAALLFTVGVNSNEAFAQDMQNIPVLDGLHDTGRDCSCARLPVLHRCAGLHSCLLQDIPVLDRLHNTDRNCSRARLPVLYWYTG